MVANTNHASFVVCVCEKEEQMSRGKEGDETAGASRTRMSTERQPLNRE